MVEVAKENKSLKMPRKMQKHFTHCDNPGKVSWVGGYLNGRTLLPCQCHGKRWFWAGSREQGAC